MRRWGLLLSLAGLAGCGEVTYIYPTSQYRLDPSVTVENREQLVGTNGVAWQKKFLEQYAQARSGPFVVSPVAAWQTGLLFLNGSEGDTYDSLAAGLGLRGDREANSVETTRWLSRQASKELQMAQGLFFVWPVAPSRTFQREAARLLGADVVKIGNGRRGAAIAMRDWSSRRTGHGDEVSLSADYVYESLSLVELRAAPGSSCQPTGLRWELEGGETLCPGPAATAEPVIVDVTEALAASGMVVAKKGEHNLRMAAIELEGKAIVGRYRQVIRQSLPKLKPGQRFQVVDATGQLILAGRG